MLERPNMVCINIFDVTAAYPLYEQPTIKKITEITEIKIFYFLLNKKKYYNLFN